MPKKRLIDDNFKPLFGNRVREARKCKRLSQEKLGDLVYVSKPTISKYEKGLVAPTDPEILQRLADALDVKQEYLTGASDFKNGMERILEKVDCTDYIESKNNDEVRRIRRFISYINSPKNPNTPLKYKFHNSILIKEIYSTEKVNFSVRLKETAGSIRLNILMSEKKSAVEESRGKDSGNEAALDLPPFYPKISPGGTDNSLYPIYEFDERDVSEDIFLEYLYQAESIDHYIEIISFEHTTPSRKQQTVRNKYQITFTDFKRQVMEIYGITVDMLLLANRNN